MKKRYIIPFVLVFVLMSVAMASADGYGYGCYQYCYPSCCTPYTYYPAQPVVRECASFVSDVTIADGSYIAPGNTFIKTWRIRNNGTTTWTTNYKLVFVSGTQMAAVSAVNLPYTVAPGQTVDISVQMTAPTEAGSYKSEWMLVNESGTRFGVGSNCQTPVWAQIVNYVQTYNYNYNYCWTAPCQPCQPPAPMPKPQPPCYGYGYCGVPGFTLDGNLEPKPPVWHW